MGTLRWCRIIEIKQYDKKQKTSFEVNHMYITIDVGRISSVILFLSIPDSFLSSIR